MENNNKLIAEFLGWDINSPSTFPTYLHQEEETQGHWELKFNTDWNWIMEAVDKIERDYKISVLISWQHCVIESVNSDFRIEKDSDTKIKATYKAVIEFIKWYNEQ